MTTIVYTEHNFREKSLNQVYEAIAIIDEYQRSGFTLTLRQLYYQFVARDLLPNTDRSYKNLGSLITRAREAGLISWMAIEDRHRGGVFWSVEEDEANVLNGIEYGISYDYWKRQNTYVEVWIEKEALANVIERVCSRWHVPYLACKGYLSASEAWRAGRRFEQAHDAGYECYLLHLGDHDPSGIDMTRDNRGRIELYSFQAPVEVRRLALNMDQVEEHNPPPNPTKLTDTRANDYVAQFGDTSWELDALEPAVIDRLIESEITRLVDGDVWDKCSADEEEARGYLERVHENWDDIKIWMDENA